MRIGRILAIAGVLTALAAPAWSQPQQKRNILVIFGDDIGQTNVSAYSMGLMDTRRRISTASPGRG